MRWKPNRELLRIRSKSLPHLKIRWPKQSHTTTHNSKLRSQDHKLRRQLSVQPTTNKVTLNSSSNRLSILGSKRKIRRNSNNNNLQPGKKQKHLNFWHHFNHSRPKPNPSQTSQTSFTTLIWTNRNSKPLTRSKPRDHLSTLSSTRCSKDSTNGLSMKSRNLSRKSWFPRTSFKEKIIKLLRTNGHSLQKPSWWAKPNAQ